RRRGCRRRAVLRQQLLVDRAQLRTGIGAESLGEGAAGRLVRGERVGGAARVAQGAQQQHVQGLVVRVRRGQLRRLRYDVVGAAQPQIRLGAGAGGLQAQRLRACGGGAVGQVGEGRAVPQGERLVEGAGGGGGVAVGEGGRGLPYEPLEDVQVDVVLCRGEAVT